MTYGIAGLAHGMNQGIQMDRDRRRQDKADDMAAQSHDMNMRAGEFGLQAAQQQYGIRGDQHKAWQADRESLMAEQEFNDEWTRAYQRYEMTGDPSALGMVASQRMFEGTPTEIQRGEKEYQVAVGDQQFAVPIEEFDAWARTMVEPGARVRLRQQLAAQLAQIEQEELKHSRDIQGRLASRVPGERVTMGEDGQFGVMDPEEAARLGVGAAGNPTALQRNTKHFVRVFKMDEQTATLAAQGRLRPDQARMEARRVAQRFIPPGSSGFASGVRAFVRQNAELAEELGISESTETVRALQALERYLADQSLTTAEGFYGIGQQQQADGRTPETAIPIEQLQGPPSDGTHVIRNGQVFRFENGRPVPVQ